MPSTFTLHKGDLEPKAVATLTNGDGSVIDLTTATGVDMIVKSINNSSQGAFRAACTIISTTGGIVRYPWASGDTDVVGVFNVLFIVTWPTVRPQSVPNTGFNTLTVEANLS